jgi:hypothetical protein
MIWVKLVIMAKQTSSKWMEFIALLWGSRGSWSCAIF